jgi:hypothetical protein
MNKAVYPYKTPLGLVIVIIFFAVVVEGILVYLAETNIRPWQIEGIYFSASNARIFFWIVAIAAFGFFAFMLFFGLFSYLTGKIRLSADRIIAPKGAFSIKTVEIPYASIKFLNVTTKIIRSPADGSERKARTLNIFHDGGKTYLTEGLLSSSAAFDEIYARLFGSISPLAQQFTENVKREISSLPR